MATFKHISSKNADYGAAEAYLTFEHDEFTMKPTLDENGRLISREDYRISSLNCGGEDFAVACMRANLRYEKNQKREDVKSHHYIISFDPRDAADNLKQMAATVTAYQQYGFSSPEELDEACSAAYTAMQESLAELKQVEKTLNGKKELQRQVLAYSKTRPVRDGLKQQKNAKAKAAYRQKHESDFIIADAAARYFRENGISKLPSYKALQAEIESLIKEKNSGYNDYRAKREEYRRLQTVKGNIDQILHRERKPVKRQEQER